MLDPETMQHIIGGVGIFVGGILSQWYTTKYRIAKQTHKLVPFDAALEQLRKDIQNVQNDLSTLQNVTIVELDRRVSGIDLRTENDHSEIMRQLNRMASGLATASDGISAIRERLRN